MPEEFLQYIWEQRLFSQKYLQTTAAEPVEILHQGIRNYNSGPDFFNARIRIDDTIWAGNVEIHRKSSDWIQHNHSQDDTYDNVILHVVEIDDMPITRTTGEKIPVLLLTYPENLKINYEKLLTSKSWIPCQEEFRRFDKLEIRIGFNRLLVSRLEERTSEILSRLEANKGDWSETFYQLLARMYGFKTNAVPMEMLSKSLPLSVLSKHKTSHFQIEALLFGQSGLLSDNLFGDEYYTTLRNEYSFLAKKYKLKHLNPTVWKFMRMRPRNFPTIRLAQFASLVFRSGGLFSKIVEAENLDQLKALFSFTPAEYWETHYQFNKPAAKTPKLIGSASVDLIIINVVVPFMFIYGEQMSKFRLKDIALDYLDKLPPEDNEIIRKWISLGINPFSAFDTQSLLQLKTRFCERKNCLNCHVGNKLIRKPE
jgi:hypothetical protein